MEEFAKKFAAMIDIALIMEQEIRDEYSVLEIPERRKQSIHKKIRNEQKEGRRR